jgi:hypothetical protein
MSARQYTNALIVSAYWDGKVPRVPVKLEEAVIYARSKGFEIHVCMDSNAHSAAFGSTDQNSRGDALETFLAQYDLVPQNNGTTMTWGNKRCASLIDVTMSSSNFSNNINNWRVLDEHSWSDHKMIHMTFDATQPCYTWKRKFGDMDWEIFKEMIKTRADEWDLNRLNTCLDLEQASQKWNEMIFEVLDELAPLVKVKIKTSINVWWSEELQALKNKCDHAFKEATNGNSNDMSGIFKRTKRKYVRAARKARRDSWRSFCTGAITPELTSKLTKAINRSPKYGIGLMKRADGTLAGDPSESLGLLMDKCFPGSTPYDQDEEDELHALINYSNIVGYKEPVTYDWITLEKVRRAVDSFEAHKSCGPDGIKPLMLQHLPDVMLEKLKCIFSASITLEYSPKSWRGANVIFIPKIGKPSYTEPGSFRPISLTSFVLKSLEKLVYWQINDTALTESPYSDDQFAFRSGCSTENAISAVTDIIEKSTLRGFSRCCRSF